MSSNAPVRAARYSTTAMVLHWLMFALIACVGTVGLLFDEFPRGPIRLFWINLHAVCGLAIFALVILRLVWRFTHRPPDLPAEIGSLTRGAAHLAHIALYALMIALPIVGIVAFVWHARVFDFGLFRVDFGVPFIRSVSKPAEEIHGILAYSLFGLVGLHALAALWHHFVRRDGVLSRMLPGGKR